MVDAGENPGRERPGTASAVAGSSPAPPLHLLRAFTQWVDRDRDTRKLVYIKTVDEAEAYVKRICDAGFERFFTWSSRTPQRVAELKGGSVYFVAKRHTLFRMPFTSVEPDEHGNRGCAICMVPKIIRCEQKAVGMVRGWRYLQAADAPPDLGAEASAPDEPPPEMARELKELGLG